MRLTRSFWAIILLFTVLNACEEIGPAINFEPDYIGFGDTTYMESPSAPEPRVVLFEEFTGVRCTNCVLGHDEAQKMLNRHPNNLISVGLHTGFFAPPIPNKSNYDFRTPEASAIETLIGNQSYPSGMVNRKLFTGENIIPLELNKWESYVTAEISQAPAVNIELVKNYDKTTRKLNLKVIAKFNQTILDPLNLSIMLTESKITDIQLSPTGEIPNYVHQHVLRSMYTPALGTSLQAPNFNAGRVIIRNFEVNVDTAFVSENCSVIAFIHKVGASKEILQSKETYLD